MSSWFERLFRQTLPPDSSFIPQVEQKISTKMAHAIYDTVLGEIFANSVHDTPSGARVNGLLLCFGVITPQGVTPLRVKQVWESNNSRRRYAVVEVAVSTFGVEVRS